MVLARSARPIFLILLGIVVLVAVPVLTVLHPAEGARMIVKAHPIQRPFTFPDGGRQIFPRYRVVALYGAPDTPELGALGEQSASKAVERVKTLADGYRALTSEHVLPALEIISTVAAGFPTENGDYSYPIDGNTLHDWVQVAREKGVYVVLDLQPGRSDFLTQARQFEDLLAQPNVGLALDPEWRLGPTQLPLEQIGSADIHEVNTTVEWLAHLTYVHHLPQKLLLLHQFSPSMLPERNLLDTSSPDLAFAIQMDGQGSQDAKLDSYQRIVADSPANVHFGWKNFYQKDAPLRSPQDTMQLAPQPWYISYQ